MEQLYTTFGRAIEGAAPVALGASLVWGILSVILSPCHLASIPLVISFISEQGQLTTRRAFGLSLLFGLGILVTIGVIGIATASMGRVLGDVGVYGNYAVAAVFFVVGLHLLGIFDLPFSGPGRIGIKRKGPAASFTLGLVFGVALGPCTFAFMAPVLGLSLKVAAASFVYAALLLALYGLGHCAVIVAAGTSTKAVQSYLNWNEESKGANIVRRVCGVLIIVAGLYLIQAAR